MHRITHRTKDCLNLTVHCAFFPQVLSQSVTMNSGTATSCPSTAWLLPSTSSQNAATTTPATAPNPLYHPKRNSSSRYRAAQTSSPFTIERNRYICLLSSVWMGIISIYSSALVTGIYWLQLRLVVCKFNTQPMGPSQHVSNVSNIFWHF